MNDPIFFAWTRSFWLGVVPAILAALEVGAVILSDQSLHGPAGAVLGLLPGITAEQASGWLRDASPLFALWVAYQRSGAARPYTLDPRAID